jgi:hypothetical protein
VLESIGIAERSPLRFSEKVHELVIGTVRRRFREDFVIRALVGLVLVYKVFSDSMLYRKDMDGISMKSSIVYKVCTCSLLLASFYRTSQVHPHEATRKTLI